MRRACTTVCVIVFMLFNSYFSLYSYFFFTYNHVDIKTTTMKTSHDQKPSRTSQSLHAATRARHAFTVLCSKQAVNFLLPIVLQTELSSCRVARQSTRQGPFVERPLVRAARKPSASVPLTTWAGRCLEGNQAWRPFAKRIG